MRATAMSGFPGVPVLTALVLGAALAGCKKGPETAVCGLHSAAGPVVLLGKKERAVAVGSTLKPSDHLDVRGDALLECFGGALVLLEKGDEVTVGGLKETKIEGATLPRRVLKNGKVESTDLMPPSVRMRYADSLFTPESALAGSEPTTGDYMKAFFTPNGIENMQGPARGEGPRKLPPPPSRPKVPHIHAGELGEGGPTFEVTDDTVFVEASDLSTAALLDGQTYELGTAIRLLLPDGAEGTLTIDGATLDLEGPMDLRLREGRPTDR